MSQDISQNNKRIAKNTLFLYMRMFVMMATSLFTSRIVLDVLGETDYGIYNIVGGVVVLFSFLNQALLSATQRYLNFYLGKNDLQQTRSIFCMSMNIYIFLSIVVIIFAETAGLWFVNTYLNIPSDRKWAAHLVYQLSIITFIVNLIRIPYNATIIAYEKMNFYAYISLVEVILKLIVVYLLFITVYDKLFIYALFYTIVPFLITTIYRMYCIRRFSTTRYIFLWNKQTFVNLFSFSGWSLFGSVANMSASQGINILINIFYGVTVNAAVGIANQVSSQIYQFISNFQMAFNPQIVKTYASRHNKEFHKLIFQTSKFSYYMILIIALPVILTTDSLLTLWLKNVPEYTAIFCKFILIFLTLEALSAPLWMAVQATGKIGGYQTLMACTIILNFPISYITLKIGLPVYFVWIVRVLVDCITFFARCCYMKKNMDFPIRNYIRQVLYPLLYVTILSIPLPLIVSLYVKGFYINIVITIAVAMLSTIFTISLLGLDEQEKQLVYNLIKRKMLKNN